MVSDKRILRAWLNGRDTPCPCCKYNLRGLTSGRCPECGSPLEISITAQTPLCFTVAIVAVGAALGLEAIHAFNYFTLFRAQLAPCSWSADPLEILVHSGVTAALAAIVVLLVRARKWWWRPGDSRSGRGTGFSNEGNIEGGAA